MRRQARAGAEVQLREQREPAQLRRQRRQARAGAEGQLREAQQQRRWRPRLPCVDVFVACVVCRSRGRLCLCASPSTLLSFDMNPYLSREARTGVAKGGNGTTTAARGCRPGTTNAACAMLSPTRTNHRRHLPTLPTWRCATPPPLPARRRRGPHTIEHDGGARPYKVAAWPRHGSGFADGGAGAPRARRAAEEAGGGEAHPAQGAATQRAARADAPRVRSRAMIARRDVVRHVARGDDADDRARERAELVYGLGRRGAPPRRAT